MDPETAFAAWEPHALVACGVCSRVAAAVFTGTLPLLSGASLRIRGTLAAALVAVALPGAVAAPPGQGVGATAGPGLGGMLVGEVLVGLGLGTAVAAVLAACGWAGGILGSVSGLSWADDFDPDPAGQGESAGIARLARWVGLAAFVAAGGQLAIAGGVIDSIRRVPVGTVFGGPAQEWIADIVVAAPGTALDLAMLLAMPALSAVIAFHLAAAICLRTIPFSPGPGLLQSLAAGVLVLAVWLSVDAWSVGAAAAIVEAVQGCLDAR